MNSIRTTNDTKMIVSSYVGLTKGWILVNTGVLFVLWGVSWLFWGIYSYFDPLAEFTPNNMMLPANLFGQSGILFGLLVLIYGMRKIKLPLGSTSQLVDNSKEQVSNIRKTGWKLVISGGLITFWGVLFLVLATYNLVILRGTPDANTDIAEQVLCFLPGLIFGVPILMIGTRMIFFGEDVLNTPVRWDLC